MRQWARIRAKAFAESHIAHPGEDRTPRWDVVAEIIQSETEPEVVEGFVWVEVVSTRERMFEVFPGWM